MLAMGYPVAVLEGRIWGRSWPSSLPGYASSNHEEVSGCQTPPLRVLQQNGQALCLAGSLELRSPSCHLPLQSISGSCMWVTQQHCSQAQEAAAELKGFRRSSECSTLF